MKNVDKDIEQFENNLIEINSMREQIKDLKESLTKLLKETDNIDEIKKGINKEIVSLHDLSLKSDKTIKEEIKSLEDLTNEVKSSMGKDTENIVNPINNKIGELNKRIDNLEKLINKELTIIKIGIGICIIISIITLLK